MSQFIPSTIEKILTEIRSIASAADFGNFVALRTAEQTHIQTLNAIARRSGIYPDSDNRKRFFPYDPDASTIDALIGKVSDLAPLPLPREKSEGEHTWLACIRECAEKNDAFFNREHARHVEVNCRFVDVLISSFKMEPKTKIDDASERSLQRRAANDERMCFCFVAGTLAQVLCPSEHIAPDHFSGGSEALIEFFFRTLYPKTGKWCYHCGDPYTTRYEKILLQTIYQSASPTKWIAKLSQPQYSETLISALHKKVFGYNSKFKMPLGEPKDVQILFRSLHMTRKDACCSDVPKFLEAILQNSPSFPPAVFNTPLSLPDENGELFEDTMLSIVSQGTHYCEQDPVVPLWKQLVELGADVNGLVENPADPTGKKIVPRRDGKTPAMLACATGHDEVVEFFLSNKDLDLTLTDNEGHTLVYHLLRRHECYSLSTLYFRDPALFAQQVTFADLDFAVRNGRDDIVMFLLSQKDTVRFEVSQLQELLNFSFEQLLADKRKSKKDKHADPLWRRCATKEVVDAEYEQQDMLDVHENCNQFSSAHICVCHLSSKLRELGCNQVMMSLAGARRERDSSQDDKNEMKKPSHRFNNEDDDDCSSREHELAIVPGSCRSTSD